MAPDPATPSPHRFVSKPHAQARPKSLSSSLRPADASVASPNVPPQFAQTPRFSFGVKRRQIGSQVQQDAAARPPSSSAAPGQHATTIGQQSALPSSHFSRPSQPNRRPIRPDQHLPRTESIEDASQSSPEPSPKPNDQDDEMLEIPPTQNTTVQGIFANTSPQASSTILEDLPPSPKRPRLLHPQQPSSHAPPSPPQSTPRRFVLPAPFALSSRLDTQASQASLPTRPSFLKPPPPAAEATAPLPEVFSPHRRGQRFVPGGMAAEVQQMVVDVAQSVSARPGSRDGVGDWAISVRVSEVSGGGDGGYGGAMCVRGWDGGEDVGVLLVDKGKGAWERVGVGVVVGVRKPTWTVTLGGARWHVGVDWAVVRDAG